MARAAKPKKSKKRDAGGKPKSGAGLTVRHYCQGIGDCHLLKFAREGGGDFFMLIDCGVHSSVTGGSDKIREVAADIAKVTKRIDVLVVTHEHWDHVSGFFTAAEEFAEIEVGDVWFAWTEDPKDKMARELDKFRADALAALQMASGRLSGVDVSRGLSETGRGLANVLGFHFGAKGEKVRAARDAARALATGKVVYLKPGTGPIALPDVPGLRIYVLGPPRDSALIRVEERKSEMYGHGLSGAAAAGRALMFGMKASLGGEDWTAPFEADLGQRIDAVLPLAESLSDNYLSNNKDLKPLVELLRHYYAGPVVDTRGGRKPGKHDDILADQKWRRIDGDWIGAAADLALQLDAGVNNTSLALAFEFDPGNRVALFPGDAQVGNWLSWQDVRFGEGDGAVKGPDLLKRTVYLKVAHHGSHNATLKEKGLELMNDADLSAFIPVNKKDAVKVKWKQMPLQDIVDALGERTSGRVIRADDDWVRTGEVPDAFTRRNGSIQGKVRVGKGLWVELDIA